jgi:hypothetical protein
MPTDGRTDGRTDRHKKLVVAFRNFAKAPKEAMCFCVSVAKVVERTRPFVNLYAHFGPFSPHCLLTLNCWYRSQAATSCVQFVAGSHQLMLSVIPIFPVQTDANSSTKRYTLETSVQQFTSGKKKHNLKIHR